MKKRIVFDDNFHLTILSFVLSFLFLILLYLSFEQIPVFASAVLIVLFSMFLTGVFVFPKMGITFNYKTKKIKYLGFYKIKNSTIKMNEIKKIMFFEVPSKRIKHALISPKDYVFYNANAGLPYIYRNGKIYRFVIFLIDGTTIEIPYFHLFKAFSKKRVEKQEAKISKIIAEFNQYSSLDV